MLYGILYIYICYMGMLYIYIYIYIYIYTLPLPRAKVPKDLCTPMYIPTYVWKNVIGHEKNINIRSVFHHNSNNSVWSIAPKEQKQKKKKICE